VLGKAVQAKSPGRICGACVLHPGQGLITALPMEVTAVVAKQLCVAVTAQSLGNFVLCAAAVRPQSGMGAASRDVELCPLPGGADISAQTVSSGFGPISVIGGSNLL
jgi:hypothetical protein